MKRISLIAGHNPKGKGEVGASGNGYHEGDLTVRVRDNLRKRLEAKGIKVIVDNDTWNLKTTINSFSGWITPSELIIDIHFNSVNNPNATGCEVFIPEKFTKKESEVAKLITDTISHTLGIANRGVRNELQSARGKLGFMRIPAENILIEVCFISNRKDVVAFLQYEELLYTRLTEILFNYA